MSIINNRKEDIELTFISINVLEFPVVPANQVWSALKEHLDYLIYLHKHYSVCFNNTDRLNKKVLEDKINSLTIRVHKLKQQLDKHTN